MSSRNIRELDPSDHIELEEKFQRFRNEYAVWGDQYTNDWEMLEFVHYEGVTSEISNELQPLILGAKCVELHDCNWCMVQVGDQWHFAINHDSFDEPVDLTAFNKKRIAQGLPKKWQRLLLRTPRVPHRPSTEPFHVQKRSDGEAVVDHPMIIAILEYMLRCTPKSFEEAISKLREPPGEGRKVHRQTLAHFLRNLETLSLARHEGSLSERYVKQHNELLCRFRPLIDDLKDSHGSVPKSVERDSIEHG